MTRRVHSLAPFVDRTALAAQLGGGFEVIAPERQPVGAGDVVVIDSGQAVPPIDGIHVIRLVHDDAPPSGRAASDLLLPAATSPALLALWIRRIVAQMDAEAEVRRLNRELAELNHIGIQLSAQRDTEKLLELILAKAREITRSDAGSLYLTDEEAGAPVLRFVVAQNDSVAVPFRRTTLPLSHDSVAGHVALTGKTLDVDDAYALPPDAPYRINRSFDSLVGYRTKSMLVLPMRTPDDETVGVLQLINRKPVPVERLVSVEHILDTVESFSAHDRALAESLASQAAVALHNRRLHDDITRLFEGFVQASVTAIESRDPTTSGHSFRVAAYALALARSVNRCTTGPLADVRLADSELLELRYAALLHDFGKVGVREPVLLKAKKLYPGELERIELRAARIRRELELRCAHAKLAHLSTHGPARYAEHAGRLEADLRRELERLDAHLAVVIAANEPTVVTRQVARQIEEVMAARFEDHVGMAQALVTAEEAQALAIPRGSLSAAEFAEIRSHVVHTFEFLSRIPWTKELRRIPDIAVGHHEKLDGTGYPRRRKGDQIPVPTRLLTIADIYDALTARDRPYKPAVAPERALAILEEECRSGGIDADLFALFVSARAYETTDDPEG